jgi:hypothetical protein
MVPCGDLEVLADFLGDGLLAYFRCMDHEGIDGGPVPSIGCSCRSAVASARSRRGCRAYNEWMAEYRADPLATGALVPRPISIRCGRSVHAAELGRSR